MTAPKPDAPPAVSWSLAAKLGSIALHAEEAVSQDGHPFDVVAIASLLTDQEVVAWLKQIRAAGLLPEKRR